MFVMIAFLVNFRSPLFSRSESKEKKICTATPLRLVQKRQPTSDPGQIEKDDRNFKLVPKELRELGANTKHLVSMQFRLSEK